MLQLIKKEINGFLNSLIGYIAVVVFLVTISLLTWVFPDTDFNIPASGYANIDPLFVITPWVYMFLVPAITMRLFSEELKTGTIELLLTKPLTEMHVVLAKYFAGVMLVFFSLIPTLTFYYSVHVLGAPPGNIDTGAMWGSYAGLLFLGAVFVSVGLFASSLSDNQVIGFIIGLFLCFITYAGLNSVSALFGDSNTATLIAQLGLNTHYASMSRGVIDTRDVVYFLSVIIFFLVVSRTILESRKW